MSDAKTQELLRVMELVSGLSLAPDDDAGGISHAEIARLVADMKKNTPSFFQQEFLQTPYEYKPQQQYSAPTWPEDREQPKSLWTLPGYSSNEDSRYYDKRQFYNALIARQWESASPGDRRYIEAEHAKRVSNTPKILGNTDRQDWINENLKMNLPESCKAPPVYTVDDHPFSNLEDFDAYVLSQVSWDLRIRKLKFNVVAPQSFNYRGNNLKFMGMETYILEWIEWAMSNKDDETPRIDNRVGSFYFRAADATTSDAQKLYELSEDRAQRLFGGELMNTVVKTALDVAGRTEFVEIRRSIDDKLVRERYKDTGMTFGEW